MNVFIERDDKRGFRNAASKTSKDGDMLVKFMPKALVS
jgi:hypothetical protein